MHLSRRWQRIVASFCRKYFVITISSYNFLLILPHLLRGIDGSRLGSIVRLIGANLGLFQGCPRHHLLPLRLWGVQNQHCVLLLLYWCDLLHQVSTFRCAVSILSISFLWSGQLLYLQFISTNILTMHRRIFEIIGRLWDDEFSEAWLVFDSLLVFGLSSRFLFNVASRDASWADQVAVVLVRALVLSQSSCIKHGCAFSHTQAKGSIIAWFFPANLPRYVEGSSWILAGWVAEVRGKRVLLGTRQSHLSFVVQFDLALALIQSHIVSVAIFIGPVCVSWGISARSRIVLLIIDCNDSLFWFFVERTFEFRHTTVFVGWFDVSAFFGHLVLFFVGSWARVVHFHRNVS